MEYRVEISVTRPYLPRMAMLNHPCHVEMYCETPYSYTVISSSTKSYHSYRDMWLYCGSYPCTCERASNFSELLSQCIILYGVVSYPISCTRLIQSPCLVMILNYVTWYSKVDIRSTENCLIRLDFFTPFLERISNGYSRSTLFLIHA